MTDFEKAEKLREKANVSFAEAKEALEKSGGDMLDAMIYLENQGKSTIPAGGGYYSGAGQTAPAQPNAYGGESRYNTGSHSGDSFKEMMRRFGKFCLRVLDMGVTNFLDATRNGDLVFSCPVIAVVILVLFFFWVTVPLFIITLFCGFRYSFRGPELERDAVNDVMGSATDVVDNVKRSFAEHRNAKHAGVNYTGAGNEYDPYATDDIYTMDKTDD